MQEVILSFRESNENFFEEMSYLYFLFRNIMLAILGFEAHNFVLRITKTTQTTHLFL